MSKKKSNWKINEEIKAHQVRVIDSKGEQIGVLPVSEARRKAKEAGKDLVEIAPKANPPVVKIIEFGKFKYQEEKKLKEQKKKAKSSELKEVRLSPFIGDADFMTRVKRVNRFLSQGNKVRVVVVFKGRQMNSKKFGYEMLQRVIDELKHEIVVDMDPKFIGRHLAMVVSPLKKKGVPTEKPKIEIKNR